MIPMLILDGKPVTSIPDSNKIIDDIAFVPGMPNTSRFKKMPEGHVSHWTGGERRDDKVTGVLKARNLSIHFIHNPDGSIVQKADLMTQCAHAGKPANSRFWGSEYVNRGFATKEDIAGTTSRERDQLDWSVARDVYPTTIGSRRVNTVSMGPEALHGAVWLIETLFGLFNIPRIVPFVEVHKDDKRSEYSYRIPNGDKMFWVPAFDRDPRKSANSRAATFKGALGHFHIHENKWDPGAQIFDALWTEGFNPKNQKMKK